MRISDDHVIQCIGGPDARLVVRQDHDDQEVVLSGVEVVRFFAAAAYFADEFGLGRQEILDELDKGFAARTASRT